MSASFPSDDGAGCRLRCASGTDGPAAGARRRIIA